MSNQTNTICIAVVLLTVAFSGATVSATNIATWPGSAPCHDTLQACIESTAADVIQIATSMRSPTMTSQ